MVLSIGLAAGCAAGESDGEQPEATPSATLATEPAEIALSGAIALGGGTVIHGVPAEGNCRAFGEYSDVKGGGQAQILDAAGTVVAVTGIEEGIRYEDTDECVWYFDVDVPAGGGFYSARYADWESVKVAEADLATTLVAILPAG